VPVDQNAMSTRPATIRDVAAASGVSTATVSKFINGTQRFSPEAERRVRAAIEKLGYYANPLARRVVAGPARTIGVVVLDVRNPHFAAIVKGANRVACSHGDKLLFVDTEEGQAADRHLLETLSRRVDGLIVSSRLPEESIQWLTGQGKPLVFVGPVGRVGIHSVGSDGYRAASMLGRHLLELGHRDIAYVGFKAARWNKDRLRGLNDALAKAGTAARNFDVDSPSAEAGERIASQVLMHAQRPDAVVAFNDLVALGLMSEAQCLGVRVPEEVSIAGFDNIAFGRYASPALTSVDLHSERMGSLAMERLLEAIAGELQPFDEILEPRLVPRASTCRRAA
jgi:DNA-binding LacI/PurR family transcriptional regulator